MIEAASRMAGIRECIDVNTCLRKPRPSLKPQINPFTQFSVDDLIKESAEELANGHLETLS
jgi:hypothetical protein